MVDIILLRMCLVLFVHFLFISAIHHLSAELLYLHINDVRTSLSGTHYYVTSRSVYVLSVTESTTNLTHNSNNLHCSWRASLYIVYARYNLVYVIYNIYIYTTRCTKHPDDVLNISLLKGVPNLNQP